MVTCYGERNNEEVVGLAESLIEPESGNDEEIGEDGHHGNHRQEDDEQELLYCVRNIRTCLQGLDPWRRGKIYYFKIFSWIRRFAGFSGSCILTRFPY